MGHDVLSSFVTTGSVDTPGPIDDVGTAEEVVEVEILEEG